MKRPISLVILLAAINCHAATKIFLRDTSSGLGTQWADQFSGYNCNELTGAQRLLLLANTTQGSSTVTTTQTPTATTPPCMAGTQNSSSTYRTWVTPPISSGFTLSGNINYSVGCRESNTNENAGVGFVLYRWSIAAGGIVSTIQTSGTSTECGTTAALRTIAAAAPTSTSMAAGDRIFIVVEIRAVGAWGGNGSRSFDTLYGGAAAGTGDAFVNFADTFTFSSDSANGRVQVGELRRHEAIRNNLIYQSTGAFGAMKNYSTVAVRESAPAMRVCRTRRASREPWFVTVGRDSTNRSGYPVAATALFNAPEYTVRRKI